MGLNRRFPAEWEPHSATWIAWVHNESDFPGKLRAVHWVYTEIVRVLSLSEQVEILCKDEAQAEILVNDLAKNGVTSNFRIHIIPTDRSWLRDSLPTAVVTDGQLEWIEWKFKAWAKYDNYKFDSRLPKFVASFTKSKLTQVVNGTGTTRHVVLEGGAIETNGNGVLLVTEECLLSDIQCRNAGFLKADYEEVFREYLGIEKTVWLGNGCVGDDTHGHIDDIARFVARDVIVLAYEDDESSDNHQSSVDNYNRLQSAFNSESNKVDIVKIPMPRPIVFDSMRLPASYANFYISNKFVLVPTFNDKNDRLVLDIFSELFSDREVVGIHALDLVWGLGTLHCLTQQQIAV